MVIYYLIRIKHDDLIHHLNSHLLNYPWNHQNTSLIMPEHATTTQLVQFQLHLPYLKRKCRGSINNKGVLLINKYKHKYSTQIWSGINWSNISMIYNRHVPKIPAWTENSHYTGMGTSQILNSQMLIFI